MNLGIDHVVTRKCNNGATHWSPVIQWQAIPASYQVGDPIGWGETEQDAIDDLLCKIQESIDTVMYLNRQRYLL